MELILESPAMSPLCRSVTMSFSLESVSGLSMNGNKKEGDGFVADKVLVCAILSPPLDNRRVSCAAMMLEDAAAGSVGGSRENRLLSDDADGDLEETDLNSSLNVVVVVKCFAGATMVDFEARDSLEVETSRR